MVVLPPDYHTDPDRWGSRDPAWRLGADVHETVAARVVERFLVSGGLFFACTRARTSDRELTEGYPPTTFDAEGRTPARRDLGG